MRYRLIMPFLVPFLTGCATTSQVPQTLSKAVTQDKVYEKSIASTKKSQIINSLETKAHLIATYLNNVEPTQYTNDEHFIVSLYFEDENATLAPDGQYALHLGANTQPQEAILLEEHDPLLRYIPSYNAWSHYYHVIFPSNKTAKDVILTLSHPTFGHTQLMFEKDALSDVTLKD